jgi:hypothetical protein
MLLEFRNWFSISRGTESIACSKCCALPRRSFAQVLSRAAGFKVLPPSLKPWVIVAGPELEHCGYVQSTFLLMKG